MIHAFVDADSLCYSAGYCEHDAEMRMSVDAYVKRIACATQASLLRFFVESPYGKSNFRKHVAVTRPYKGNRADKEKPKFLLDAKLYLKQKYAAEFVVAHESEDEMSICAQEHGLDRSIKCCIDKDAHQHPGRFYDYRTEQLFDITEDYARFAFWRQVLTGDSVDNIPGLAGVGPKKAEAILAQGSDFKSLAVAAYRAHNHEYAYFVEQCRLIYILKKRGEVFTPCTKEEYYS